MDEPAENTNPIIELESPAVAAEPGPRRSQRIPKPSQKICEIASGAGSTDGHSNIAAENPSQEYAFLTVAREPDSTDDALHSPNNDTWIPAMADKIEQLRARGTFELVEPPPDCNIVGSRWTFKLKLDTNNVPIKAKARFIMQGFSQQPGVDFNETYAPTANFESIQLILAIANKQGWPIHQADYKNTHLNSTLDETIYIKQPASFVEPGKEAHIWLLKKALYGLKQSGRLWYLTLKKMFVDLGYSCSKVDPGVFFKISLELTKIVAVHVDDSTIVGDSETTVAEMKRELGSQYEIADLGEIHWLLGLKIKRDKEGQTLALSQTAYIETLLRRFNMQDASPISMPLEPRLVLSKDQCPRMDEEKDEMRRVPYREIISSLLYLTRMTHPDVSYTVTLLARFMSNPGRIHWEAAKRLLRYIKGTKELRLTYGVEKGALTGYTDADWGFQNDRHSISGYAFVIDGRAITWSSKKQPIVALSTTEAELIAATHAGRELKYIRNLWAEMSQPLESPTTLHCDNQSTIAFVNRGGYSTRNKHLDIRYTWVKEMVDMGDAILQYCRTDDMVADIFTKALARPKIERFAAMLGVYDPVVIRPD